MTQPVAELNHVKHAPKVEGVLPLFHARWSPRAFADREVSAADLARVFEAARWAASASNEQPWRFLVGTRGSEAYQKIFDTLVPFNQLWAASAPVLILDVAKSKSSRNDAPNRSALYDLGAAAAYLTLQASALGLATHQMGGFDADAARKAFGIPDDYIIGAVIALGYQGEPDNLPNDQLRNQEKSPRSRKPLSEFVFSAWETPADLA
jgi:nitroreductase